MNEHQVKASWKGAMFFEAEGPGGTVALDAPAESGGTGKGSRSKPLMLTSLAGCTGMDIASLIPKMRIDVADFHIEVIGKLSDTHPRTYTHTHVIYTFQGPNLDQDKIEKAVDLSFDKYCGVITMFRAFSEVTKEIRFNP